MSENAAQLIVNQLLFWAVQEIPVKRDFVMNGIVSS